MQSSSGNFSRWFIFHQSLAHADDIIHGIAEPTVEFDDRLIGGANLQVDFWAAYLAKPAFGFR